jgi:hypothetical protein
MKSNLMKSTLGVLAMSILGLAATGARADWDRGSHDTATAVTPTGKASYSASRSMNVRIGKWNASRPGCARGL